MSQEFIYPYSNQYIIRLNNIAKQRNNQLIKQQKDILNNRISGSFSVPIQTEKITSYSFPTRKDIENHDKKGKNSNIKKRSDSPSITTRGSIFSSSSSISVSGSNSISISKKDKNNTSHSISTSTSTSTIKRSKSVDNLKRQSSTHQNLNRSILEQPITKYDELTHGYRYQNKSNEKEDFHTYNFDQHSSPSINRPTLNVVNNTSNNNIDNQDNNYSIPSNESNNLNNETNIQIKKKKKNNKLKSSSTSYRSPTLPSPESFSFSLQQSRSNNRNLRDDGDISNSRNDNNNNILVLPVQYTSDTFTTSRYSLPSDHILPLQHGVIVVSSNITLYELVCRLQEQFDLPVEYNITLYTRERKDNSSNKYNSDNDVNCDDTLHKWNEVPVAIQTFPQVHLTLSKTNSPNRIVPFLTDTTIIHITPYHPQEKRSTTPISLHTSSSKTLKSNNDSVTQENMSIFSEPPSVHWGERLPVDGINIGYRKKILETPSEVITQSTKSNSMKNLEINSNKIINQVKEEIKSPIQENIQKNKTNESSLNMDSNSNIDYNRSPIKNKNELIDEITNSSPGSSNSNRRGTSIFSFTQIEDLERDDSGEDTSISLTIEGSMDDDDDDEINMNDLNLDINQNDEINDNENNNIYNNDNDESDDNLINLNLNKLEIVEIVKKEKDFKDKDFIIDQLVKEKRGLKNEKNLLRKKENNYLGFNEKPVLLSIDINNYEDNDENNNEKSKEIENNQQSIVHWSSPPTHSFHDLYSPPPPPPSSSPIHLSSQYNNNNNNNYFHNMINVEERSPKIDLKVPLYSPYDYNETKNSSLIDNKPMTKLSTSPTSIQSTTNRRTTPTSLKSFQFRQYYENVMKERKQNQHQ